MAFEDLRGFLMVAQHGSFLSAAVALGVSRTTLRRQVEALEAQAGVPLFQRRRSGVTLTDAGQRLATRGRALDEQFNAELRAVRDLGRRPEGQVRCLVPVGLPPPVVALVYRLFRESWPGIQLRFEVSPGPLSADLAGVDVVVWFGLDDPGPDWVTQTMLDLPIRLFASKPYLDAHGTPTDARELEKHDLLGWIPPGEEAPTLWTRAGVRRPCSPTLATSDVDLLHESARLDLGIVWAPDAGLPQKEGFEPFVGVLESTFGHRTELRLAVPSALIEVPKVRVFFDAIAMVREVARNVAT